jgi:hypothetical protein
MPKRSPGVGSTGQKSTGKDQGKITVVYRNTQGKTFNAEVVSIATDAVAGHLKLKIRPGVIGGGSRTVDNVPLATSEKSTNAYFYIDQ